MWRSTAGAVGNVARAMGMSAVAEETQLGRPSLYKALTGERDPRIGTVISCCAGRMDFMRVRS